MISIIIPTYNEEKDIAFCLHSLLKQVKVDFEIIVVDDGSKDQTVQIIKQEQQKNPQIKFFQQQHQGPGLARNLGATKAQGDILVFVDADMTFDECFIYELTFPIKKGLVKGTFSKNERVNNWKNHWSRCWNYNQDIGDDRRISVNYPEQAPVFRALLKSEFSKVGGFDPVGYTDDWTLSKKLGYKSWVVEGALYYHRNPENLKEIFYQARWIGKNEFISGRRRKFFYLIYYSFIFSLFIGMIKAIRYKEVYFIMFKIIYDLGVFISILTSYFNKSLYPPSQKTTGDECG